MLLSPPSRYEVRGSFAMPSGLSSEGVTMENACEIIRDLAFFEDFAIIITAGLSGICHWDLQSATLKKSMDCTGARSVSTSSSSGIFPTGNDYSIVHVRKKDFKLACTLGEHAVLGCAVRALDFSRSGAKLVVGTDNAGLSSWDLNTCSQDHHHNQHFQLQASR